MRGGDKFSLFFEEGMWFDCWLRETSLPQFRIVSKMHAGGLCCWVRTYALTLNGLVGAHQRNYYRMCVSVYYLDCCHHPIFRPTYIPHTSYLPTQTSKSRTTRRNKEPGINAPLVDWKKESAEPHSYDSDSLFPNEFEGTSLRSMVFSNDKQWGLDFRCKTVDNIGNTE